jgi:predicted aspartyl protease
MALPQDTANLLRKEGLAIHAGTSPSKLADGSVVDQEIILIHHLTVEGRVLENVEAVVAPSDGAMTLLGLGALNRLGSFKIENGKLVFTEKPAADNPSHGDLY